MTRACVSFASSRIRGVVVAETSEISMTPILKTLCIVFALTSALAQPGPASANTKPEQRADVPAIRVLPNGRPAPAFLSRHAAFVTIARRNQAQVVFIGDSLTAYWRRNSALFQNEFGQYGAVNFGIPDDRTQHVLWRVQNGEFDGFTPKVAVLLIGTNNAPIATNPPNQIASGVRKIIRAIHLRSPQTKVLLMGIFPRASPSADAKNREVNALIARFHDGRRVYYLDIRRKLVRPDGTVGRDIMPDGLHLSAKGYRIWADAIRGPLAGLTR
jgi:N-acetylglucosamine-6-sulfatase